MGCGCCRQSSRNRKSSFLLLNSSGTCSNVPKSQSPPEATPASCPGPWMPHLHGHEPGPEKEQAGKEKELIFPEERGQGCPSLRPRGGWDMNENEPQGPSPLHLKNVLESPPSRPWTGRQATCVQISILDSLGCVSLGK